MKVILMNGISLDGFIATPTGDSDWVLDGEEFEAYVRGVGCIIIGRLTFEQYHGDIFPIDGASNFVYTSNVKDFAELVDDNLHFVKGSPAEALDQLKKLGFEKVILAGGSKTNASFAQVGLIDEMILDVHPILLGEGKRLLGDYVLPLNLELMSTQHNPKGFLQNHYKVSGKFFSEPFIQ